MGMTREKAAPRLAPPKVPRYDEKSPSTAIHDEKMAAIANSPCKRRSTATKPMSRQLIGFSQSPTKNMGKSTLRCSLGLLHIALLISSCGPRGDCEQVERLYVPAKEGCPSLDEATRELRRPHVHYSVEELVESTLIAPVTVCWYRASVPAWPCEYLPSRLEVVAGQIPPSGRYTTACDPSGQLYGVLLAEEPTSISEALSAVPADCAEEALVDEKAQMRDPELEVYDFVGRDFFEALLSCSYETTYKCRQGDGPRGGSGTIGI